MLENDWKLRRDGPLLRDALCEFFECRYGKIRFLEEKNIGKVRADMLAVLPDSLLGIEIKSHSDSYERLKTQIRGYDAFCDLNFLCVGSIHVRAAEHVPPYWGILAMTVRDGVRGASGAFRKSELQACAAGRTFMAQRACRDPQSEGTAPV